MPELRKDPIIGRWVIISTERSTRPNEFKANDNFLANKNIECPFCEGNEHMTPPETLSYRPGGGEVYHWHIEYIPSLTKVAGFEWGTGFYINPISPEDASKHLKNL